MKKIVLCLIIIILSVACGAQVNLAEAPEIRHGEDVCQRWRYDNFR